MLLEGQGDVAEGEGRSRITAYVGQAAVCFGTGRGRHLIRFAVPHVDDKCAAGRRSH